MTHNISPEWIKNWAEENYNNSHYAQTIIECWGEEEYAKAPPSKSLFFAVKSSVDDRYSDITGDY